MSTYREAVEAGDVHIGDIGVDTEFARADLEAISADRNEKLQAEFANHGFDIDTPSRSEIEEMCAHVYAYDFKLGLLDGKPHGNSYREPAFRDHDGQIVPDDWYVVEIAQDRHRYMDERLTEEFGKGYDLRDDAIKMHAQALGRLYFERLIEAAEEADTDNVVELCSTEEDEEVERQASMSRHPTAVGFDEGDDREPSLKLVGIEEGEE